MKLVEYRESKRQQWEDLRSKYENPPFLTRISEVDDEKDRITIEKGAGGLMLDPMLWGFGVGFLGCSVSILFLELIIFGPLSLLPLFWGLLSLILLLIRKCVVVDIDDKIQEYSAMKHPGTLIKLAVPFKKDIYLQNGEVIDKPDKEDGKHLPESSLKGIFKGRNPLEVGENMAEDRKAYERRCANPKCRVRTYDAGMDRESLIPCPHCGSFDALDRVDSHCGVLISEGPYRQKV